MKNEIVTLLRRVGRMVNGSLCRLSRRYKFCAICIAIGVDPYPWQREFALHGVCQKGFPSGRRNGKTAAIMMRLLMLQSRDADEAYRILAFDPDWEPWNRRRTSFYISEYRRLSYACFELGIPVVLSFDAYPLDSISRRAHYG